MRLTKADLTRALAARLNFGVGLRTPTIKASSLDRTTTSNSRRAVTKFKVTVADRDELITSKANKSTSLKAMCRTQEIGNRDD